MSRPSIAQRSRESPYPMISFDKALKLVTSISENMFNQKRNDPDRHAMTIKIGGEDVCGHVLAQDVVAPDNVPSFRASIMDGYAVLGAFYFNYDIMHLIYFHI